MEIEDISRLFNWSLKRDSRYELKIALDLKEIAARMRETPEELELEDPTLTQTEEKVDKPAELKKEEKTSWFKPWEEEESVVAAPVNPTVAAPVHVPGWNGEGNKENARTAINYLTLMVDKDGNSIYSRNWANAIVGVLNAESGLVAGRVNPQEEAKYGNNAGKGIAQWSNTVGKDGKLTSTRRSDYDAWMKDKEVTLENELEYFNHDLSNNRSKLYEYIKSHPNATLDEAVDMIHRWYENGSANAAATRELMIAEYAPRWKKLGYRDYDFDQLHAARVARAKMAASL